jgi:multiple sugar transport system substrate-binding protein
MFDAWVYDAGGGFVDDVKRPTRWTFAEDPNTFRGLRFRWELIHKHKVMPPPSVWSGIEDVDGGEMFATGRAAMFLFGLWKTPRFREIRNFRWDAAMLPHDPRGRLDFHMTGSGSAVLKNSRNKKAAWSFVKFITSQEGVRKQSEFGLSQPALVQMANSPVFLDGKDPRNKKLLLEAMKYGKYEPFAKNWLEVKGIIETGLVEAWKGNISVEQALARLKPVLEKNPPITT